MVYLTSENIGIGTYQGVQLSELYNSYQQRYLEGLLPLHFHLNFLSF